MRLFYGCIVISLLLAQEERIAISPVPLDRVPAILRGRVIEARTGEPLPGVQIRLSGRGGFTDERGAFVIPFESADTLIVFLSGYRTLKVYIPNPSVEVLLPLMPIEAELEEVQIVSDIQRESETGAFIERLRSLEIGELYSQELIMKRSTDFYAPNVLRRLPGVSLLSGRFVSIRGMGERYNAFAFWAAYPAWLNYDASFGELDQLITTLLGRIEVRKFWTPELLGHFGGGMVDFQLPTASTEGWQISFTTEADAGALGRPFASLRSPLKSPLPSDFPPPRVIQASENRGVPLPENFTYGRQVQRYTIPDTLRHGPPGVLLSLSLDKRLVRGGLALRAAYSRRYLTSEFSFQHGTFVEKDGRWSFESHLDPVRNSPLHVYNQSGGLSWHAHYSPTLAHALTLEGFFLASTVQKFSLEEALYINPDIDSTRKVYSWYSSLLVQRSWLGIIRPGWSFNFGEWQGRVQLGFVSQKNAIPQAGAMNYVRYPDSLDIVYERELYNESEIYAQIWTSKVSAFQGYVHPHIERRWGSQDRWIQLRVGGWYSLEQQRFRGRQVGFMPDTAGGFPFMNPNALSLSLIREVYSPSYIQPGGWYLIDRTSNYHRHRGTTQLSAGYGWIRASWNPRWEILGGLRYETWQRHIWNVPVASEQETTLVKITEAHLLPAMLLKYRIGEIQTLRIGTNLTLIRPPFPTQVPLAYFDYFWGIYWRGDQNVQTGRSWNADIRWEWLRSKAQLFAIGLFYKRIWHLPETYLEPASYTLTFSYAIRSRSWGEILGIELETRYPIWETGGSRLWSYATLTVSESGLEQPVWGKIGWLEGRLQGHAPIVGNAGLIYTHPRYELAGFLTYTSLQIWAIGFDPYIYPHVIERGRVMVEGQATYRLGDRWELRLAVWDFINQPYRRTQQVGNVSKFRVGQDTQPTWERWAYRFYLTVRYILSRG
ncbi:MAG: hypothetical protein N3E49_05155 [Bacteroidia bacterium]|nr:hypothetical protein [Bacteroidia bacterium]